MKKMMLGFLATALLSSVPLAAMEGIQEQKDVHVSTVQLLLDQQSAVNTEFESRGQSWGDFVHSAECVESMKIPVSTITDTYGCFPGVEDYETLKNFMPTLELGIQSAYTSIGELDAILTTLQGIDQRSRTYEITVDSIEPQPTPPMEENRTNTNVYPVFRHMVEVPIEPTYTPPIDRGAELARMILEEGRYCLLTMTIEDMPVLVDDVLQLVNDPCRDGSVARNIMIAIDRVGDNSFSGMNNPNDRGIILGFRNNPGVAMVARWKDQQRPGFSAYYKGLSEKRITEIIGAENVRRFGEDYSALTGVSPRTKKIFGHWV